MTGVQTCALPISNKTRIDKRIKGRDKDARIARLVHDIAANVFWHVEIFDRMRKATFLRPDAKVVRDPTIVGGSG